MASSPLELPPQEDRDRDGKAFFREMCTKGWKGIIAEDAGTPYVHRRPCTYREATQVTREEAV